MSLEIQNSSSTYRPVRPLRTALEPRSIDASSERVPDHRSAARQIEFGFERRIANASPPEVERDGFRSLTSQKRVALARPTNEIDTDPFGASAIDKSAIDTVGTSSDSKKADAASLFDRIKDFVDELPKPIKDFVSKVLDKLTKKLEQLVSGGKDPQAPTNAVAEQPNSSNAVPSSGSPSDSATDPNSSTGSSFEDQVRNLLQADPNGKVHEEGLFAAVMGERVRTLGGPEAAKAYQAAIQERVGTSTQPNSGVSSEQAAIDALKKVRDSGLISPELADRIYSQAFAASQLDANQGALFDGKGSATDNTIATAELAQAIAAAKDRIGAFDDGRSIAPNRTLDGAAPAREAAGGSVKQSATNDSGDGQVNSDTAKRGSHRRSSHHRAHSKDQAGFLWKPVSDSNGKLVILLPPGISQDARSVVIKDANGEVVGRGKPTGIGNGDRAHFRFNRPGSAFEGPLTVEAQLADGTTHTFRVKNPSQRYEIGRR